MTPETIRIRDATGADVDILVEFNQAMALESEGKTLDTEVLTEGVRHALGDPRRCVYYVAQIDGVVVGQTMVTTEWSDWRNGFFWWIQSVYVDPDYRRRGVFRALYGHVRALARDRDDVCGLRLYVHDTNGRAIETYRKLGMTRTAYLLCEEAW